MYASIYVCVYVVDICDILYYICITLYILYYYKHNVFIHIYTQGGDDFNAVIVNWILEQVTSQTGTIDLTNLIKSDPFCMSRIYEEAENTKIRLSTSKETTISIPYIYNDFSIQYTLTRSKFEMMSKTLFQRLLRPIREVAVMAGVNLPGESGLMSIIDSEDEGLDYSDDEEEKEEVEGVQRASEGSDGSSATNNSVYDSVYNDMNTIDINKLKKQQKESRQNARNKNKLKGNIMKQVNNLQKSTGMWYTTTITNINTYLHILLYAHTLYYPPKFNRLHLPNLVPRRPRTK